MYERQREQHPVITSVTDIILDVVLAFREDYESYIKVGYPFITIPRRRLKSSMVALPVSRGEAQARIKTERGVQGFPERNGERPTREETRTHYLYITARHAITPVEAHPGASAEIHPRRQVTLFTTQK